MPFPFSSALVGGTPRPVFVAAGNAAAGVSIPVAASGAQVGDLLLVFSPYNGIPTLGGGGWNTWADTYNGGGAYSTGVSWKLITSTADVTVSGAPYGTAWAIWRGARAITRNSFVSNNLSITWGALQGDAAALAVLASVQTSDLAAATMTGLASRASGWNDSTFNVDILDSVPEPLPAATRTLGVYSASALQTLTAIEIRA